MIADLKRLRNISTLFAFYEILGVNLIYLYIGFYFQMPAALLLFRWLFSFKWKFSLICIKTAPYMTTTWRSCFCVSNEKSSILRLRFCHSRGFYMRILTPHRKKICEIIKHIPPKMQLFVAIKWRDFIVLSDEFLEKRQSFLLHLSGNYERTFLQRHTITFLTAKYLRKRLYFAISCPCLYVGILRKKV